MNREKVAAAVYAFILAWRALGHTRIDTRRIAEALQLSHDEVLQAIRDFEMPGVEPIQ